MGRLQPLVLVSSAWSLQGYAAIADSFDLAYLCQCLGWDGYERLLAHRPVYLPAFFADVCMSYSSGPFLQLDCVPA